MNKEAVQPQSACKGLANGAPAQSMRIMKIKLYLYIFTRLCYFEKREEKGRWLDDGRT